MITLNCHQDLVKDSKCHKIIPYEAEFIFPELRMTIDSCQDLAEKKLQKNTPLRSGIYFPGPQDDSRLSSRFARKQYASKKYPPTKWNLFFWCFNLGDRVPKVDFLCPFFLKFAGSNMSDPKKTPFYRSPWLSSHVFYIRHLVSYFTWNVRTYAITHIMRLAPSPQGGRIRFHKFFFFVSGFW